MKIDTTKIPGFDSLPEEAKNAITAMELTEEPDPNLWVAKSVFDKKASEAGDLSKKLRDKMTDEEAQKAEMQAKWDEMEAKLQKLESEKQVSTYKASYLALGYSDELAQSTAEALVNGDMVKVFENQKKAAAEAETKLKEELMNNTPRPDGAGGDDKGKESKDVEIAKRLGKAKAESFQNPDEILKKFM